ncbi:MAG: 3-methyl-2-oxobutanoate dehydrogenase [Myxococcales bacterium]|nr:3-methyl-2-oxobutanoate dehydrogenase [Myxococcales bacterium]
MVSEATPLGLGDVTPRPVVAGASPSLYRVLADGPGESGGVLPGHVLPSDETLLRLYRAMALVRAIDERMITLQRQGRISFYGAATGQEAAVIGSGLALDDTDWVVPALREGGIALLRGLSLSDYVNQLFGNGSDIEKGRQMPCHYGHKGVRYVTLSSCIANQLFHAVGIALAARLRGEKTIAVGYMGDGATSEGDFHVAMEFAARLRAPVLLFCQNNQWAISTGVRGQTLAATMAQKAHGYGMDGYRVDGNDVLAVHALTTHVVSEIRRTGRPAFIEALTYRIGAHSTSDDPTRYRDESITERWRERDPLRRLRPLLDARGLWDDAREVAFVSDVAERLKAEVQRAEADAPPTLDSLFDDVYASVPSHLAAQRDLLRATTAHLSPSSH